MQDDDLNCRSSSESEGEVETYVDALTQPIHQEKDVETYVDSLAAQPISRENQKQEQYVSSLPTPTPKKSKEDSDDEEEEDVPVPEQSHFAVRLEIPEITQTNPLFEPFQPLTLEYIWQESRPRPTLISTNTLDRGATDHFYIESASAPPSDPNAVYRLPPFFSASRTWLTDDLNSREASKGKIQLKTPIIEGEWVVNMYTTRNFEAEEYWKHVGKSATFSTRDAKIRVVVTPTIEPRLTELSFTVKAYRKGIDSDDRLVVCVDSLFPENVAYTSTYWYS